MSSVNSDGYRGLYKQEVSKAVCTEKLKVDILEAMSNKAIMSESVAVRPGIKPQWRIAMAAMIAVVMIFVAPVAIGAFEKIIIEGISYNEKDIEGVEGVLKLWFNFDKWGQELELQSGDLSAWQECYPEFYSQLVESDSLDVCLPHYGMSEYEWSQGYGYIGMVYEGDAHISARFTKGDSIYIIGIHRYSRASGSSVSGKLEYHEEIEHNGIQYQIYKYSDDYTYEEYCKVFEETIPAEWENVKMSEEEFYQWMMHPIYIKTKINGYEYSYSISEDIDIEEFLDTVY